MNTRYPETQLHESLVAHLGASMQNIVQEPDGTEALPYVRVADYRTDEEGHKDGRAWALESMIHIWGNTREEVAAEIATVLSLLPLDAESPLQLAYKFEIATVGIVGIDNREEAFPFDGIVRRHGVVRHRWMIFDTE